MTMAVIMASTMAVAATVLMSAAMAVATVAVVCSMVVARGMDARLLRRSFFTPRLPVNQDDGAAFSEPQGARCGVEPYS